MILWCTINHTKVIAVFNFSQEISDISFKEKENLLLNNAFIHLLKKCEMFVKCIWWKVGSYIFFSSLIFQINATPSPDNKNSKILKKKKIDSMFVCLVVRINTISLVIFPVTIFQVRNVRKQLSWYPEDKFSRSSGRNSQTMCPATTQKETKVRDKIH